MSFGHLVEVGRIHADGLEYFGIVEDWRSKRFMLEVMLLDLPALVSNWKGRTHQPYDLNPRLTVVDHVPEVRLASACESSVHALYSMAELAAKFGGKVTDGRLASNFNRLRRKIEEGKVDPALTEALGDLQWYKKVRELRTEWTHHSTIFIGGTPSGDPHILARGYRDEDNKVEFQDRADFSVDELTTWMRNAIQTLDQFADYLVPFAVNKLDLNVVIIVPIFDERGTPVILPGDKLKSERITLRETLRRRGVPLPPANPTPAAGGT